ncbi:MAG: UDP-2,3-diacylglucosamine diphosphatase LpxI [Proteobacteria bacterium]|nr:UDP-2,3-diacylglucosamine diphosphatase LpxI [Pseudomonadota bacterium]
MTGGPLGILAGGGELPRRLIAACQERGRPCYVVAFEGHAEPATVDGVPHGWATLGAAGRVFELLRGAGVRQIVLAGAIKRPSLLNLKPDVKGAAVLARIGLRALGDDGLLRAVVAEFEREGFQVLGAQDVLISVAAPAGVLGRVVPDDRARTDIGRGVAVARALGAVDVGQAVVVQQGIVLGVEAAEGTEALLARVGALRRDGPGGVLVKLAKPGQDHRVDLPAIGSATVRQAAAAGLVGIAIEARVTLVLDLAGVIAAADAAGLFVEGLEFP